MGKQGLILRLDAEGTLRHIYEEDAIRTTEVLMAGRVIRRASHVEPDEHGQWWVDLSPVGGPKLGPYPADQRSEALQDEVAWLEQHLAGTNDDCGA